MADATTLPTAAVLQQCQLSPTQQALVFREFFQQSQVPAQLSLEQAATLWMIDLVYRIQFLSAEARMLLLRELLAHWQPAAAIEDAWMLVFYDRLYAAYTDSTGFFELATGQYIPTLPYKAVFINFCDVTEWCRRQQHLCDKARQHATDSPGRGTDPPTSLD